MLHFESVLQADFQKHFKFAFTISNLAKCLFHDFALKIRAFTGKSTRPLVQNRHYQKVRYFRATYLPLTFAFLVHLSFFAAV